jgi:hypothetical protein
MMLVCNCGRTTPLPEESGRYVCSNCNTRIELTYLRGPDAWEQWQRRERQRVFERGPFVEPPQIELRPIEAASISPQATSAN